MESLNQIRKMEGGYTGGLANSLQCIKDSFKQAEETVEELFGGRMTQNMLEHFCKDSKQGWVHCIEHKTLFNMRDIGSMACFMEKGSNIF